MSVLLRLPVLSRNTDTKLKTSERGPRTLSILLLSATISIAIIILLFTGMSIAGEWYPDYSVCRDKIIGYEQTGLYKSTGDFIAALSYCG